MSEAFLKLVNMSISASWLVLAVLVLRLIFKKAPKWVNVLLWGIVAVRLICPFSIESALSLIPSQETISPEIMVDWTPEISTGIEPLDQVVNPVISTSFAPEPSASANPLQILIPVAANIWLLGVLAMLIYTAVSYISLRRKLRTAVILRNNIFQCETVQSPFVLGIFRPRIYLPYAIHGVNLHHVVAHEQAHIRRKDHWWKPLGFLLLTVYWFNPLMWVAYVLLCRDIELACDEKVIAQLGNDQRADYTQALAACSINRRMIAACPLAFGEVGVKERVKSIMNYRKPAFWIVVLAIVACIIVAVCFLTDPVDPAEDTFETDGMNMHQTSFLYATEDGYYLLIGADGVQEIQVSLPDSSGGVVNADGSLFEKGEKVYLEHLQNVTDLRGLSITALGKNGEVIYGLSIPEDASMEEAINTIGSDGWLLAPTAHIVGPAIAGKTFVYENEGILGNFTITLYEDGTFSYYEGNASSYFGVGIWQQDGSIVTLADDDQLHPLVNKFIMDGDDLVFVEQGSSNFIYVKVKEGEHFHCTGEAFKNADSAISPEQSDYPFKPTMEEITDQLHELQGRQTETESSDTENAKSAYETNGTPSVQALYEEYISRGDKGSHIYVDLDEDGVQELFIYRPSSTSEIATISENKAVTVMAANHLFLCDGGIIGRYSEGGGGCTVFYYKMDDNKAVTLVDTIMTTFRDDAWYRSTDPDLQYVTPQNMTRITKEEAQKAAEQYTISEEYNPSMPWYLTWLYGEE